MLLRHIYTQARSEQAQQIHFAKIEDSPENGAVTKITKNKENPNANAIFSRVLVLLRKQDPVAAVG